MIPTDLLFPDAEDHEKQTKESFEVFSKWCGALLPDSDFPGRMLFVKLDPASRWLMCFPFTSYIRFKHGEFANFTNVNWIVTDRSFSEVVHSRSQLRKDLSNLANLLQGTVIVVNCYARHVDGPLGPQVEEAIEILRLLLGRLKDVDVEQQRYTLRSAIDPSAEELAALLLDPMTHFVFADFEASSGRWQLSDCRNGKPAEFVDLQMFKCKLDHIQLLRVFHCNSVFRPRSSVSVPGRGQQPADDSTIVRKLLETGAQIVEGGMTRETFPEFFYAVVQLIFSTGLYCVLQSASVSDPSFSLLAIAARCSNVLAAFGFDPIAVS